MAEPRRAEPRIAEPRMAEPRTAAPPPPAYPRTPERPVSRGAEHERHADQRYDGYADPNAPEPRAASVQGHEPPAWRETGPDLADPYHTEAGWRPPRKRQAPPRPQTAAGREPATRQQDYDTYAAQSFAERPRTTRAAAPPSPVQAEPRRTAAYAPPPAAAPMTAPAPVAPAPAPRVAAARAPVAPASPEDPHQAYARYAPASDGAYEAGDYYDDPRPPGGEQGRYGRDVYPGADAYNDGGGVDYEDQGHGGGRRRVWLALGLLALAVIGTGGAYAVRSMFVGSTPSKLPPVIHADTAPKKIAAAQPGDKQLQDRVGDRGIAERVVPREETPMAIKDPNASALVPGVRSPADPPAVSAPATTSAADTRAPAPGASEPKRIRTVTIRPENAPAEAAPAAPSGTARTVPPATPATARTVPPAKPAGAEPQPASAAPPSQRARTAVAAPPPRVNPGDYMVQLSAQKSEADARTSFRVLQSKYSSVLGGRELVVRRKDLGSRGVYFGAQVGPFASRGEAAQLCEELKAQGGSCLVERN